MRFSRLFARSAVVCYHTERRSPCQVWIEHLYGRDDAKRDHISEVFVS